MCLWLKKTTAKFWIDNRERLKNKSSKNAKICFLVSQEVQEEIEETVVVAPEDPKKTGVVKIKIKNDYVKIFYPKDSDFREIVKEKEYILWSWHCLEIKKTSTSGELIDRAAELGNALLANGFTVQFPDEETKNLAISGTLSLNMIIGFFLNKSTGKLSIVWKGYNDFLFQKSKLLPGAKWNNGSRIGLQRNFTAKLKNLRSSWVLDFPSQPLKLSRNIKQQKNVMNKKKFRK